MQAAAMQHVPPSRSGAPVCPCRPISASSDVIKVIQSACDSVAPAAEDFPAPSAPPAGELRLSHAQDPSMGLKILVAALAPLLIVALVAAPRWAPLPGSMRCSRAAFALCCSAASMRAAARGPRLANLSAEIASGSSPPSPLPGPRMPRDRPQVRLQGAQGGSGGRVFAH